MASLLIHSSVSPSNSNPLSSFPRLFDFKCKYYLPNRRKHLVSLSAVVDAQASVSVPAQSIQPLKLQLLSAVSGLNRGLAASEEDLQKADSAAKEIEAVGGAVDLSADLDKLQGRWKLIYSSAFSSRTLGGSRPGPPTGRLLPITLGQVSSAPALLL